MLWMADIHTCRGKGFHFSLWDLQNETTFVQWCILTNSYSPRIYQASASGWCTGWVRKSIAPWPALRTTALAQPCKSAWNSPASSCSWASRMIIGPVRLSTMLAWAACTCAKRKTTQHDKPWDMLQLSLSPLNRKSRKLFVQPKKQSSSISLSTTEDLLRSPSHCIQSDQLSVEMSLKPQM